MIIDMRFLRGAKRLIYVRGKSFANWPAWAANHNAANAENTAYCLINFLDVILSLLYRKGGIKAFGISQEGYLRSNHDQSFLTL
jgi:hypothetical protein